MPQEGLEDVARAVSLALDGAGDQRNEYWRNRVAPFWFNIWPKLRQNITASISENLANLALNAGCEFPAALDLIHAWLMPLRHPSGELIKLLEAGHCRNFPRDALRFLSVIIAGQQWIESELEQCLAEIILADPQLRSDDIYIRLKELCQR